LKGTLTKSQERAKERTLRRREVVRQDAIVPPGMTYLESRSVRTPTILDYTKRFQEFQGWMNMHQINIASPLDLDSAAVEFLEDLFEANRGVNDGVRVIAAIKFFWPHLAKEIPRTSRALKGWNLAAPPQQRMPVPIEVLSAIMGVFLQRGSRESALRLFIQFVTYMRPGECSQLLVKQLVRPQGSVNQSFNFWAILLHPMEDLTPGKTGIFDGSVVLDSDLWVNVFLERLVHGKDPLQPLWSIPHGTFRDQFNKIISQLQLDPLGLTLYALRHGGATHDVLARRRPILEVKQRGRWSSDSSLKRYVKEARLQAELSKVPRSIKEFGQLVLQNLPVFMENPSLVPKKVNGIIM
jgi:hypothetical protein